jgi:RNA polymerase sigma-70 factor, ECF subfamily
MHVVTFPFTFAFCLLTLTFRTAYSASRVNTSPVPIVFTVKCGVTDLAHLVGAAQGGDRHAFGELYARYARAVHGVVLSHVPRNEVEDLVQDVFMIAMQRLRTLRDPDAFGGWLAAIARNRATDYLRRAPHAVELTDDALGLKAAGVTGMSAGTVAPDQSEALMVLAAIRALPEAYRETLVLRLVEGMTGPEIAQRTGLTAASVRVNLHRGMKQLRERLERA